MTSRAACVGVPYLSTNMRYSLHANSVVAYQPLN